MERRYAALVLLCAIGMTKAAACDNVKPGGDQCDPFGSALTDTCTVAPVKNATGINWLEAQRDCELDDGRLFWTTSKLYGFAGTILKTMAGYQNYDFFYIGLMMSAAGDRTMFWKPNIQFDNYTCGSKHTYACTNNATVDNATCLEVGCCRKNGQCMYPDIQTLTIYDDKPVNTSSIDSAQTRTCVGLRKLANGTLVLEAFDCFQEGGPATGYICQYNCATTWKEVDVDKVTVILAKELTDDTGLPVALIAGASAGAVAVIGLSTLVGFIIYKKKLAKMENSVIPIKE